MKKEHDTGRVAIAIPIYRPFSELSGNEVKTLLQIRKVLAARDIFYIHPSYVDTTAYLHLMEPLRVRALRMPDKFFGSLERSNRLLVNHGFYKQFSNYRFVLIHHTDAWVFSDQLDHWCGLDIDYVGAPWFEGKKDPVLPLRFIGVGNGGLSLRKVSSFMRITADKNFLLVHFLLYQTYRFLEGHHYQTLRRFLGINYLMRLMRSNIGYEDEFWGLIVPRHFRWFKVAHPELALQFSFEVLPEVLWKLNNYQLPFGCHAWERYDPAFWSAFIPVSAPPPLQTCNT